jgi:hypothetical protein
MRIFNIYIGGELACAAMTEKEEITINKFINDISNDPNEHEAAMLEDIKNGATIEIIEEGEEDVNV